MGMREGGIRFVWAGPVQRTTVCGPMSWSALQAASAEASSRTTRPVRSSASKLLGVTTLQSTPAGVGLGLGLGLD